jgi:hypothetical protein
VPTTPVSLKVTKVRPATSTSPDTIRRQVVEDLAAWGYTVKGVKLKGQLTAADMQHLRTRAVEVLKRAGTFDDHFQLIKASWPAVFQNHLHAEMASIVRNFERSKTNVVRTLATQEYLRLADGVIEQLRCMLAHTWDKDKGRFVRLEMAPGVPVPLTATATATTAMRKTFDYSAILTVQVEDTRVRGAYRELCELIKREVQYMLEHRRDEIVWFVEGKHHWYWGRTVDASPLTSNIGATNCFFQSFNLFRRMHEVTNNIRQFSVEAPESSDVVKLLVQNATTAMQNFKGHTDEAGITHFHYFYEKGDTSWMHKLYGTLGPAAKRPNAHINTLTAEAHLFARPTFGVLGKDTPESGKYLR